VDWGISIAIGAGSIPISLATRAAGRAWRAHQLRRCGGRPRPRRLADEMELHRRASAKDAAPAAAAADVEAAAA
jgi:hypothetical protein